jgi:phytoene dehydrogenase-like protein
MLNCNCLRNRVQTNVRTFCLRRPDTAARGFFAIEGGAGELANLLAQSITRSGGTVRLNSPALRLAYDTRGYPTGVTLLSGETVTASRALVSNLTVWDTYGKLVGLDHTPLEIRNRLKVLRGWGLPDLHQR